jgi:6-phosphogluconolactonase (cycloisomerase 2 family)
MPEQVAVDSDTSRAVVSNYNDHAVVFVDLVTGNLLATVDMLKAGGRGPRGLALDQELGLVMVVHQQSNIVVLVSM